jgi:trk system potassium uptake protein TrkH
VTHNKRSILKDEELRLFAGMFVCSVTAVTVNLFANNVFGSFGESLRSSAFHVSSVMTTTCYTSADFNYWPLFTKAVLVILMFCGGCAGSTSG